VGVHHQNWLRERGRAEAELNALEEKARVRERHAAFVEYHGDRDLQRLYFSVPDKDLRKELISQSRRLRKLGSEFSKALLADTKEDLAALETPGFTVPWVVPGLLACVAVWIGYSLRSMPGALAGAVAGFFAGSAYISRKRSAWRLEVASAKREVENQEAGALRDYFSEPFSETEEESGSEDEGRQPEPKIHWYARLGDIEGIKREIAKGTSVELQNDDAWGSRPLHRAAANGNVDVIEFLVSQGADVRAPNILHGWLPIHYAAQRGSAECIRTLLKAGSPVDARDRYDHEPLHRAAEGGDPESINVLLDAGANVNAQGGSNQQQPIHAAAWAGHSAAVEALLAGGADPNAENAHGARPLYFAGLERHTEHQKTMRVLEAAGAKRKERQEQA
jgi:ankyrin repeat protein